MYDQNPPQYGQGPPMYGQMNQNYGYGPPQPQSRPQPTPEERKRKKLKQTKIGLGLLLGAVACLVLGILAAPVPCINSLLGLGMLGLGISAFVMLIIGADALEKPHKVLVIGSLVLIVIAFMFTMVIAVVTVLDALGPMMGNLDDEFSGQDLIDLFETTRTMAFLAIVPNVMMAVGYAMILFKPAKKWGRPMLGIFVGLALISSIGAALISYSLTGNVIDDIDPDREDYSSDDLSSFQTDITMNSWLAGLVRLPEYIIYSIVAIGAFLNIRNMEEEVKPKLDNRLYNLEL